MSLILQYFKRVDLSKSLPLINYIGSSKLQLHTTSTNFLKEIVVTEANDKIIVEGKYIKSQRENNVVKNPYEEKKVCVLCALNLNLKHTDVLILSQFLRSDGCVLPRTVTGLCNRQQKILTYLVAMAQKAGLMPNLTPHYSKKDPSLRYGSKKFHRYFKESTVREYVDKYKTKDESDYYPIVSMKPPPKKPTLLQKKLLPN